MDSVRCLHCGEQIYFGAPPKMSAKVALRAALEAVAGDIAMSVLGWRSPWSGDEADPIPRRYWLWYRLYRWTRKVKHWIGWHDWRDRRIADQHSQHCDWCGANR